MSKKSSHKVFVTIQLPFPTFSTLLWILFNFQNLNPSATLVCPFTPDDEPTMTGSDGVGDDFIPARIQQGTGSRSWQERARLQKADDSCQECHRDGKRKTQKIGGKKVRFIYNGASLITEIFLSFLSSCCSFQYQFNF